MRHSGWLYRGCDSLQRARNITCGPVRRWQIAKVQTFSIHPFCVPVDPGELRAEIRSFIADNRPELPPESRANSWAVGDAAFSRALGRAGYIGMTWPKAYGGHERHALERYIVLEELLAAGAPVGMHWIADRQSGALLLRYGNEALREKYVPGMAAGEIYACIGMSEPGAGSDLAAVRTAARRKDDGWVVNGQKVWTTNAHNAAFMIALVRTSEGEKRQDGLSQVLIELDRPGVDVRPVIDITGGHDFNEVFLDDVFVPDENILGQEGNGWRQVTAELSLERSGPERYLSSYALVTALADHVRHAGNEQAVALLGRMVAETWSLRSMSMSVAAKLAGGDDPALEAAIVKDLGNGFEQDIPRAVQAVIEGVDLADDEEFVRILRTLLMVSPSFSLRGGTREILKSIIARGLGLR
ncbi:acyl-CoA dehydrogenase [Parvularcula marina]|uniref:Acyl-CoA dehydrogenase n=1 Tax=Parvularcula marina TaxID=2292771 RepID=A0A371RLE1_9PROT|nr:acyl-CoA dehydrogenase [Parvularcula marina]